eukprot:14207686-Alexandrium_andersonii.AAC.1
MHTGPGPSGCSFAPLQPGGSASTSLGSWRGGPTPDACAACAGPWPHSQWRLAGPRQPRRRGP